MTQIGTAHFVSRAAADAYYRAYGFTAGDVARKLAEREIHIGPPPLRPGQRLVLVDTGRRYAIEED